LLLDTGVFAMILTDDPRLTETARSRMASASRVSLSAISLYEIGQKVRLGKWPEMGPFVGDLAEIAHEDGVDLIPLTPSAALRASLLDWAHRDPFDRTIAVTSLDEDLVLMSPDAAFDAVGVRRFWT
jgi:PIN domain nuclease of toxin-antitoxin system